MYFFIEMKRTSPLGDFLTCGLNDDELKLLNCLFQKRNFKPERAQHIDKIRNLFHGKIDVDETIRSLLNKGYVGCVSKTRGNKYYCNAGITIKVLQLHGYPIPRGGRIPL